MSELLLEARQLRKTYPLPEGELSILKSVDFELRSGETFSIRGASGCGKTTLLNVLAGLEHYEGGEVKWRGRKLPSAGDHRMTSQRSRFIGLVFQSFYLLPELNAIENVCLPARMVGNRGRKVYDRAKTLLESVGLGERLEHRPTHLSGGERQRVAMARALINEPPVLLADEPTGNLDEHSSARIMDLLFELADSEGTALVLVTHDTSQAARAAHACVLEQGVLTRIP